MADRKLTVIRGKIYDLSKFMELHPGGRDLVSLAVGRDATILFESYHIRNEVVEKRLASLPQVKDITIADLAKGAAGLYDIPPGNSNATTLANGNPTQHDETFSLPNDSELYQAIRARVRKEVITPRGKESGRGDVVLNSICVIGFWLFSLYLYLKYPSIVTGAILGLAGVWVGVGVQHTANHGGLTRSPVLNRIIGLGDDIACGGSSLIWRYHHQVSHHIYTNVLEKDQDVFSSFPLMRFDADQPRDWFHKFQAFYAPLAFSFLWWSVQLQDITCMLSRRTYDVRLLGVDKLEELLFWGGKVAHYFVYILLPIWLHGWAGFWAFTAFWSFGSVVLALVFIVSHNVEEAKPQAIDKDAIKDWARWQIETSATWGGAISGFFMGGLNFQIEHHLFPGVAHNLYVPIQKIVQEECKKRKIAYHAYDNLYTITVRMFRFLHVLGNEDHPKVA